MKFKNPIETLSAIDVGYMRPIFSSMDTLLKTQQLMI